MTGTAVLDTTAAPASGDWWRGVPPATPLATREGVLRARGADEHALPALLAVLGAPFDALDPGVATQPVTLPWDDEAFVRTWADYDAQATEAGGIVAVLRSRLVQLAFGIEAGMSTRDEYLAATRRGQPPSQPGGGLTLVAPAAIQLRLHQTAVGRLPVLVVGERTDFESLVRAFVHRNEPVPVPPSMGACLVAGYNNWDRVARHRRDWARTVEARGDVASPEEWAAEFRRFSADKSGYQDRFMLLSTGPYSNVSAASLGLETPEWLRLSVAIRLDHECAHYVTRRMFGAMRQTVLDELLADHAGLLHAQGTFPAAWFLRFMGLENAPAYRAGGRLENYLGTEPLPDAARTVLHDVIVSAAGTLEQFTARHFTAGAPPSVTAAATVLVAIARLGVEVLAAPGGLAHLEAATFSRRSA
ncbi:MAG: hypothetical protein IT355_13665 [Gemmatimonadaceae bacterium]|nr:hypothetical protein [Gemmatimonadaceae bacterium]